MNYVFNTSNYSCLFVYNNITYNIIPGEGVDCDVYPEIGKILVEFLDQLKVFSS